MGYLQVRYDFRVVNYDHILFTRLATGEVSINPLRKCHIFIVFITKHYFSSFCLLWLSSCTLFSVYYCSTSYCLFCTFSAFGFIFFSLYFASHRHSLLSLSTTTVLSIIYYVLSLHRHFSLFLAPTFIFFRRLVIALFSLFWSFFLILSVYFVSHHSLFLCHLIPFIYSKLSLHGNLSFVWTYFLNF